jgi:hypothetical protein
MTRCRKAGADPLSAGTTCSPRVSPERDSELLPAIITQPTGTLFVLLHWSRVRRPHSSVAFNLVFLVLQLCKLDRGASLSLCYPPEQRTTADPAPTTIPLHLRTAVATTSQALHEL